MAFRKEEACFFPREGGAHAYSEGKCACPGSTSGSQEKKEVVESLALTHWDIKRLHGLEEEEGDVLEESPSYN
eukprot:278788-Pelagomonas_calceolata.AAC.1